jgi:predicted polyphosphate/ATP-dependent NAD kinase
VSRQLGLVVNPVAGVGGPAGLKGSDGTQTQANALARGATLRAGARAAAALAVVAREHPRARILTVAGPMGADAVRAAGLTPVVVGPPVGSTTTAADTRSAVAAVRAAGAGLVLFAGGDGTARDVVDAAGESAVLGIPAGVKMYSACFAVSPAAAGSVAGAWLSGPVPALESREVLDVTEDEVRAGRVDPRLHGTLVVPVVRGRTQSRKSATASSQEAAVAAAAAGVVERLRPGVRYLLGPGSTLAEVARQLDVPKTPLGVDVILDGELVLADASEAELLQVVAGGPATAVVTVIGGQGFLLGRGNQQLSAAVIARLGEHPLLVVATEDKLIALAGQALVVDTGDAAVDRSLAGYARVITGPGRHSLYPVIAPEQQGALQCA